ncbi:uncharacterized protein RAG0_15634 [Rhynchosporium agropyri]|uniref:Zn(2)-C6 fungal-type domain-containing protein n=1 Tax=Rhynchosporium agropyri TaxID=914238 RepID=A0A1E1LLX5_9HELO|nr:uncharacterized protein RAG0_15634 [Rhynchosporium agropyri]
MGCNGMRSGACQTCRKRRVKCDLTEPACQRCAKAKVQCEGYANKGGLKFVDEKEKAEKRVKLKREAYLQAIQVEDERIRARKQSTGNEAVVKMQSANLSGVERETADSARDTAKPPLSRQNRHGVGVNHENELSVIAFQDNIHMSFLLSKFWTGAKMFTPWMMKGCRWNENCTTTQTMKALSGLYFGRIHRRKQSMDFGFQCYSKALRLLSKDLVSTRTWELPSLTNVLSLSVFEIMASPSGQGFLQHEGGVARLIQSSNPERFQSQDELAVFEYARLAVAFGCADLRIRCFLAEPEWITIPWLKHPEAKDLKSLIYDSFCDFPGCCITKPSQDPKSPFPTAFHFQNLPQAAGLAHYNTVLLVLLRAGRILKGLCFSSTICSETIPVTRTNSGLLLPQDVKTLHGVAGEILRSVEYCISEPHTSGGYFQMLFPLRAAIEVYKDGCKERKYLYKIFNEIADNGGFEMSRGLTRAGLCGRMIEDEESVTDVGKADGTEGHLLRSGGEKPPEAAHAANPMTATYLNFSSRFMQKRPNGSLRSLIST